MAISSESPFVTWRKKAKVAGTELALALGISKTHLSDLERGTAPISGRILSKIAEMGLDPEAFNEKHEKWMKERRATVMERLKVDL